MRRTSRACYRDGLFCTVRTTLAISTPRQSNNRIAPGNSGWSASSQASRAAVATVPRIDRASDPSSTNSPANCRPKAISGFTAAPRGSSGARWLQLRARQQETARRKQSPRDLGRARGHRGLPDPEHPEGRKHDSDGEFERVFGDPRQRPVNGKPGTRNEHASCKST